VKKSFSLPDIPEQEQTPVVKSLLVLIEQLIEKVQQQDEQIALLKDEINILKGEKKRPVFKPSKLDKETDTDQKPDSESKKQSGSRKKKKNIHLVIHKDKIIKPTGDIPEGSILKGHKQFIVQDVKISSHNTRYLLEHWVTPDNKSIIGKLPSSLNNQHFGPELMRYIVYQYHHCQVTQPLLLEQLHEWNVDISSGQINRLLLEGKDTFHQEKDDLLQSALAVSPYITVDDSGARHKGKNGFVTQMGNDWFAWFQSTSSKSRVNFLALLQAGKTSYCLTDAALNYMKVHQLPEHSYLQIASLKGNVIEGEEAWLQQLAQLSISNKRHIRIATEGALFGSALQNGLSSNLVILSDDAGQFNVPPLAHALCWVHTERLVHKMLPLNDKHKQEIALIRGHIWDLYAQLKQYKKQPNSQHKEKLDAQFDRVFTQQTSYVTLNLLLKRIHKNKDELLMVLKRPEIPLHTNGSETDIRDYVKRRKVSGGTRSDEGRRCRDTFASLKKTCRKLEISFWDYLGVRLAIKDQCIPSLGEIVDERARLAMGY